MTRHQGNPDDPPAGGLIGNAALLERTVVLLLFLSLATGVLLVLLPFATAILFGTLISVASWPLRQALVRRGARPGVAAGVLLGGALALVIVPVLILAPAISDALDVVLPLAREFLTKPPPPPWWVAEVPLVGGFVARRWTQFSDEGEVLRSLSPYAASLREFALQSARALTESILQLVLSFVVATMFWAGGDSLGGALRSIFRRLGGESFASAIDVASRAMQGVLYGVVGTAILQAVMLTVGLAVAGIPAAAAFGFVGLLLAISQVGGPLLVLIWGGAAYWLFQNDQQAWAVAMVIWGVAVSTVDNVVKPLLIGSTMEMPLSLVILGVFGGFIAFGFLGLFIGPTLLAVAFAFVKSWLLERRGREAAGALR